MQIRRFGYNTQLRARLSKEMSHLSKVTYYFRTVAFIIIAKNIYFQIVMSTRSRFSGAHKSVALLDLQSGLFPNYWFTECS